MSRMILLISLLLLAVVGRADIRDDFPRPEAFEPDVRFWQRIYTEVGTDGGLLHDNRHLDVVYEVIRFPDDAGSQTRSRVVDEARSRIRDGLLELARDPQADDRLSRELRALWGDEAGPAELRAAADRIRFQLGQRDRFLAGLERSGRWDPWIREVMREHGVPEGMVALPHVESSFTPYARSRAGAAGMWQFTRGTGQRFMQVDHVVDERLDPWRSSEAAAQLLRHNYQVTGSWPLALTAYNHGAAGVRRAVSVMGSDDIVTLARQYEGRRFGFASRNFYPAFLAALDIHADPERFFDPLSLEPAQQPNGVEMPAYVPVSELAQVLGTSEEELRRHNPALLSSVWNGSKLVPRGYALRLPPNADSPAPSELLSLIPAGQRFARQEPDRYHVLQRGETLSHVANRYGTSVAELVRINRLRSAHRVRAGERLTLPAGRTAGLRVETMPEDGVYEVRRGDNLSLIAARFRTTVAALRAINELEQTDHIYPGQVLRLRPEEDVIAAAGGEDDSPVEALETVAATPSAPDVVETAVALVEEAPGTPVETQPELAADPRDHSVAADGRIVLQWGETLGHHADWLDIPTQRLRHLNGLAFGEPVVTGQRLRLDFARVSPGEYEQRRVAFHERVQEAFFRANRIVGSEDYTVTRGDSLWRLTRRSGVPEWLILQYNPDVDMERLRPGQVIRLPEVVARD
ncbi:LysM peptidoglycan-binding domain-containing protein [Natronospira bacteriovora]|uniref:LysM peptidoglycan-binding domain-containing protein n=1 Tax=Natronospira bacteriovora TaxID=3069753 RepID=A0ABU0W3Y2_9GAMM|nr:LysM peptidoglycan-binding domain-containing protein [Natronospira sp. AB-CW4]MDQ2068727.1 LysM peptidoglycan-binding domain-containing protein [Natronospira sp. AB-CW4]